MAGWLTHPLLERLGWTLLHFLWQGAAAAALLGVLLVVLRRRPATWRYAFSTATLFLMAALPPLTFLALAGRSPDFAATAPETTGAANPVAFAPDMLPGGMAADASPGSAPVLP